MNPNILILLTIAVTAASSQPLPPGLVTTIISDLLAPNTRPVLIDKRNVQKPVRRFAITDLPKTVKVEPKKIIVRNLNGVSYPNNGVVIQKPEVGNRNVILHKGAVGDKVIVNQAPILKPVDAVPKTVVIRKEIPKRVIVNETVVTPQFVPKQVQQKVVPVQQKVVISDPRMVYPVKPLPKKATVLAPLAKVAMPVPPQSKGRFLRKIPIPPPSI